MSTRPVLAVRAGTIALAVAAAVAGALTLHPPWGPVIVGAFLLLGPPAAAASYLPPAPLEVRAGVALAAGLALEIVVAEALLLAGLFSGAAVVGVLAVLTVSSSILRR